MSGAATDTIERPRTAPPTVEEVQKVVKEILADRPELAHHGQRAALRAKDRRNLGQKAVELVRLLVPDEDRVQLLEQGRITRRQLDVLRDSGEVAHVLLRVRVTLGQVAGKLHSARQEALPKPVHACRPLAEVRARAEERDHLSRFEPVQDDLAVPIEKVDGSQLILLPEEIRARFSPRHKVLNWLTAAG